MFSVAGSGCPAAAGELHPTSSQPVLVSAASLQAAFSGLQAKVVEGEVSAARHQACKQGADCQGHGQLHM